MTITATCPCGSAFKRTPYQAQTGRGKYCSKPCMYAYRIRPRGLSYQIKVVNKGWYKPGHGPTGGECPKGVRMSPATEFKPGQRASPATEFRPGETPWNAGSYGIMPSGPAHHSWTESPGYDALHRWVRLHKPMPERCEHCPSAGPLDASNVSGQYLRDLRDWQYLCRSCHFRHDREHIPGAYAARYGRKSK